MVFNFGKCKCLHTEHGNLEVNHPMGGTFIGTTVTETDVEVTVNVDMKVSEQCDIEAANGNQIC